MKGGPRNLTETKCVFKYRSKGVTCMESGIDKCSKCGWNAAVEEQRIEKIKADRRKQHADDKNN